MCVLYWGASTSTRSTIGQLDRTNRWAVVMKQMIGSICQCHCLDETNDRIRCFTPLIVPEHVTKREQYIRRGARTLTRCLPPHQPEGRGEEKKEEKRGGKRTERERPVEKHLTVKKRLIFSSRCDRLLWERKEEVRPKTRKIF